MFGSSIKDKLNAYRYQKYREQRSESIKNMIQTVLPWNGNKSVKDSSTIPSNIPSNNVKIESLQDDLQDMESTCSDDNVDQSQCTMLRIITALLYFLLWAILYIIAIEYEFGAVYFILSTLIFIWLNTHSRPKKQGELSAYSVFNPNCKAIEGTLDASQFENEIRYGIGSIR